MHLITQHPRQGLRHGSHHHNPPGLHPLRLEQTRLGPEAAHPDRRPPVVVRRPGTVHSGRAAGQDLHPAQLLEDCAAEFHVSSPVPYAKHPPCPPCGWDERVR